MVGETSFYSKTFGGLLIILVWSSMKVAVACSLLFFLVIVTFFNIFFILNYVHKANKRDGFLLDCIEHKIPKYFSRKIWCFKNMYKYHKIINNNQDNKHPSLPSFFISLCFHSHLSCCPSYLSPVTTPSVFSHCMLMCIFYSLIY